MNKVLAAAAIAASVVAGSAVSAQAATQQFFFGPISVAQGTFTVPAFTFADNYVVTGITFSDSQGKLSFGPVSISNTAYTDTGAGSPFFFRTGLNVSVAAGDTLNIQATAPRGGSGFNGNITVSTVPLPGSVALFGTAVMGLGVVGAMRRKGRKAAAANA